MFYAMTEYCIHDVPLGCAQCYKAFMNPAVRWTIWSRARCCQCPEACALSQAYVADHLPTAKEASLLHSTASAHRGVSSTSVQEPGNSWLYLLCPQALSQFSGRQHRPGGPGGCRGVCYFFRRDLQGRRSQHSPCSKRTFQGVPEPGWLQQLLTIRFPGTCCCCHHCMLFSSGCCLVIGAWALS